MHLSLHLMGKHCDKTIDIKTKAKHRKRDFTLKIFLVLKVLLRLGNFDAVGSLIKLIFNKIANKVKKRTRCKNDESLYLTIVVYLWLI